MDLKTIHHIATIMDKETRDPNCLLNDKALSIDASQPSPADPFFSQKHGISQNRYLIFRVRMMHQMKENECS